MFVASHTEALGRFDAAVRGGDLQAADRAAREMSALGPVGLLSALELVLLMGRAGDRRFEGASRRWWARLAQEPRSDEQPRTLTELQIAAVALNGIPDARVSRRCEAVLRLLVRWIDEEPENEARGA
jgi:hypothetical protein